VEVVELELVVSEGGEKIWRKEVEG